MKRLKVDSTLHLPSFCGVPTLRGSTAKDGALAIDTCGDYLYMWTNSGGWDTVNVSGGGGGSSTDTTSLSNRINLKIDSLKRSNDSVYAYRNGVRVFQYKDSLGISGSGSQYYVPKFSASTTLQNSQIFDSVNVGINTTTPAYKLDVNGTGRINDIYFIDGTYGGNRIFGGNLMEYQTNDSVKQHLFTNEVGSDSLTFGTFGGADAYVVKIKAYKPGQIGQTGTAILRLSGDEGNEKFTFLTNGDLIDKNLATNGADKMVTVDSLGKLKSQTIPSGGGSSDTIYTQSPIMYITRNDSNIIYFNADTANVWRSNDTSKVVIAQVHNATGTTLLKGEVVYLSGSTGNVASVKRANNKQDSTSSKTLGLVRRDIPAGSTGFITTQGQIEKLNLGSYADGDVLWLDSIDGQFTKVKPQAPYHGVFLGIVERANNGNGLAYIKPQNGVELDEVHDVQINNVLNNQIIVYSDTQKVWKNRNIYSVVDTTNRIATKSNLATKLNASDTASLSNRINLKLNISDTSAFQRKSIPSYSILANNTSATANVTAQQFRDTSGVYPGASINWSGTTAPLGTTTHTYRLTQVGKCVTVHIALVYSTNGAGLTSVQLLLPPGAPAPAQPTGLTGSIFNMYPVYGQIVSSVNQSILSNAIRGFLRNNSAANGYEIFLIFTSAAPGQLGVTCQYWTN